MYFYRKDGALTVSQELPDIGYADEVGCLALGGEYSADCFIKAYRRGIFPWPSDELGGLLPWYCPWERFVVAPEAVHVSHSLRRTIRKHVFEVRIDHDFDGVLEGCARVSRRDGVWIVPEYVRVFRELYALGVAHCVASYQDGALVGGFFGTCFGHVFSGESMFYYVSDAAKVAFCVFSQHAALCGLKLIDCQCPTANMARYGGALIAREAYLSCFFEGLRCAPLEGLWDRDWVG